MKPEQMETHVKVLGWLYILANALILSFGMLGLLFMAGIGAFAAVDSQEFAPFGIMSIIGVTALGFFLVLALPGLAAGYGLLKRRNWARILALVVGFFSLFNVPVGTALGAYTFYVLLQQDADSYFLTPKTA